MTICKAQDLLIYLFHKKSPEQTSILIRITTVFALKSNQCFKSYITWYFEIWDISSFITQYLKNYWSEEKTRIVFSLDTVPERLRLIFSEKAFLQTVQLRSS